jgi:hypothetical protein
MELYFFWEENTTVLTKLLKCNTVHLTAEAVLLNLHLHCAPIRSSQYDLDPRCKQYGVVSHKQSPGQCKLLLQVITLPFHSILNKGGKQAVTKKSGE